jgi:hypothetical protein
MNNRLTDGGKIISLTYRPRSTLQKHAFLLMVFISTRING